MRKYTLLVKCRVFAVKSECTYNKKWVLKSLAIALVILMYYELQNKGGLYCATLCFSRATYDSPNKQQLHP